MPPTFRYIAAMNKVYGCVVSREDHYTAKDGSGYSAEDFQKNPDRYLSTFSQTVSFHYITHEILNNLFHKLFYNKL